MESLSTKRVCTPDSEGDYTGFNALMIKDVKEFIKILKEEFIKYRTCPDGTAFITARDKDFQNKIDELAGEKLI